MVDRRPQDFPDGEPDGITDNTTAIQAAIDAWQPGDQVILSGGTFRTTATITIPDDGLILRGDAAVRAKTLGGGAPWTDQVMFEVTGDDVVFDTDGLELDQANVVPIGISLLANGAAGLRLLGVISRGTQLGFVSLGDASPGVLIADVDHLGKGYGVLADDPAGLTGLVVRDCVFEHVGTGAGGDAVLINCPTHGGSQVEIIGVVARGYIGEASGQGIGFAFSRVTDGRIVGCLAEDCEGDGFHFERSSHRWLCADLRAIRAGVPSPVGGNGSGLIAYDCDDIEVLLMAIADAGYHGIALSGQGTTVGTGGQLQTGCRVQRCSIDLTRRDGIHLTAQDGALVDRCFVRDPSNGNPNVYAGIRVGRQGGTLVECQNCLGTGNVVELTGATTVLGDRFVRSNATGCVIDGEGPAPAPIAADDDLTVVEDEEIDAHVLANDSFFRGTENFEITVEPDHGTAFKNPNGTVHYDPDPGYTGPDSFGYHLTDAAGEDDGTSMLTVVSSGEPDGDPWLDGTFWSDGTGWVDGNAVAPVAVADSDAATAGGAGIVIAVADNDTWDAASKADLDFQFDTTGTEGTGIAKDANGDVTYTPPAGEGDDTFDYRIRDDSGLWSNFATVTVSVAAPAPVAVDDPFADLTENTGDHDIDVLANDTYAGTPSISITAQSGPGTATVVGTGAASRIRIPSDAGVGSWSVTYELTATGNSGSDSAELSGDVVAAPSDAYADAVAAIDDPVAYWRLGDTSAALLADASGNGHHGTYPQTPAAFQAVDLTWDESDGRSVDFGASGYGEVAHDAAFLLAEGSLSLIFEASPTAVANDHPILSKGSGLVVRLEQPTSANGTDLVVDFGGAELRSPTSLPDEATPLSAIEAGRQHHVCLRWDDRRVWLCLDGHWVDWSDSHTSGLTTNTSAWQFGRGSGSNGDVQIDEVVLYDRLLTNEEVDDLFEAVRRLVPYTTAGANEVAANTSNFASVVNGASPGDHILMAAGTYGGVYVLTASGTRDAPIVIRPADTGNRPNLTGRIELTGTDWVIVDGLDTSNGGVWFRGATHSRVTRVVFDDISSLTCIDIDNGGAVDCRIDHCEFTNRGPEDTLSFRPIRLVDTENTTRRVMVDHNRFYDLVPATGTNGQEVITVGVSNIERVVWSQALIEYNLFDNIDIPSEAEIISLKSSGGIFRYNTCADADNQMYYQARQCGNWEFRSNLFRNGNARLLRLPGYGHFVIGNTMDADESIVLPAGNASWAEAVANLGVEYASSEHCLVVGNDAPNDQIAVGDQVPGVSRTDPCVDIVCEANSGTILVDATWGGSPTIVGTTNEPFAAAVELTSTDVGRGGPAHARTPAGHW